MDSGQLDAALPLLERAEAQKDGAEVQTLLGRLNLTRMNDARAVEHFDAALADSRAASALSGRGRAEERMRDEPGACGRLQRRHRSSIRPRRSGQKAAVLAALRADEHLDEARRDAAAAWTLIRVWWRGRCRGVLQLRDGEWSDARASFDAVLAVEGGNPDAIYGRRFRPQAGRRS